VAKPRLGQILVADGTLSDSEIARALGYQRFAPEPYRIGSILLNWELIAEEALLAALAKFHHCPAVNWTVLSQASPEALARLTAAQARRFQALPYGVTPRELQVAFLNPSDLAAVDEVAQVTGRRVLPAVTTELRLAQAFQAFYQTPLPRHFRAIIRKLDRPKAEAGRTGGEPQPAKPPAAPKEEASSPVHAPSPEHAPPLGRSATRASSVLEPRETHAIPEIRVPDFPTIGQRSSVEVLGPLDYERALDPVVEELAARLPRVIVFGVAKSSITGWTGQGPGVSRERLANLRIPAGEQTVLGEAAKSGVPHFGPVEPERFPRALGDMIETEAPSCAVFPIRVSDGLAALLYADRLGEPLPYEDFAVLARAAASAGNVLSHSRATPGRAENS
jgi:hypothetical protein